MYALYCVNCKEALKPIVATKRGELLVPDYDSVSLSPRSERQLRQFHDLHAGHELKEIPTSEVEVQF